MKVQDKINKSIEDFKKFNLNLKMDFLINDYEFLNNTSFSVTIKKENRYFILIDDYNEIEYKSKNLEECYAFMYEDTLERLYEKQLQAEREEQERAERKHNDQIYWDKQLKVTA